MAVQILDTVGQKRPKPVLTVSVKSPDMRPGDVLEVLGDCPTFEKDLRKWCQRLGKMLISVRAGDGNMKKVLIQF